MERQLLALQEGSKTPTVRAAASKVTTGFRRCIELCDHMPLVKDQESFYSLLTPFVARIKAMEPGGLVVTPVGWRDGLVMLILHCDVPDAFTIAVVSSGDGLSSHPSRADPATGAKQFNTPLVLQAVPAARVRDSAVWFVLLKACFFPEDDKHDSQILYQRILPFFTRRPPAANLAEAVAADSAPRGTPADSGAASAGPQEPEAPAAIEWITPVPSGDPHGYELATRTAAYALHLSAKAAQKALADSLGPASSFGGDNAAAFGAMGAVLSAPLPSSFRLLLLSELKRLCVPSMRQLLSDGPAPSPATSELLRRACKRLSATTRELTSGAAALPVGELGRIERLDQDFASLGAQAHP